MPGIMQLRKGFFAGAQADAEKGIGAMSPGTSTSGGMRGDGDGNNQPKGAGAFGNINRRPGESTVVEPREVIDIPSRTVAEAIYSDRIRDFVGTPRTGPSFTSDPGGRFGILDNTLLGSGLNYLMDQYNIQKQKNLFANTMDPGIPKDRIADLINRGGNDNQGIASLPYMYPTIQVQEEIIEEPEEISFYDILRQNLGLV